MPSLPPTLTPLCCCYSGRGDQLSCAGPGCGDSLPKCPDVRRTPCEPPICTSWNICRAGTSHLKGVQQRADTTQRSALHRAHHLRWQARGSPWWSNTNTHTKRAHLSAWHLDTCSSLRCKKEKCRCPRSAVHSKTLYGSVLRRQRAFLKCPVQLRGWCATCVQQGAPTCRHTWDNPGAQESKWRYQKSVTPHFTWQGMSWVIIK